jgi:hypothetical protein
LNWSGAAIICERPKGAGWIGEVARARQACHVDGDAAGLVLRQHLGPQRFGFVVA